MISQPAIYIYIHSDPSGSGLKSQVDLAFGRPKSSVTKFFAEGVTKKGGKNFYQLPLKERDFFRLFSVKEMNKVKFVNKIELDL